MEKLRISFLDFWPEFPDENIFLPILQKYFDVEETMSNPQIIIHSIFGGMKNTPKYKCKKILFLGENWRPQQFKSDYSISFDSPSETNFRLPLWQVFLMKKPELMDKLFNRVRWDSFDRFCSFTVSNPNNFFRNAAFEAIRKYKHVHSYGRYLVNDMGLHKESQDKYWRDAKLDFFTRVKHKFAITYEHSSYPYYCTEKMMDGFLEGSIPIYWGSTKINQEFNDKAFINAMKLQNDKLIEYIKFIDNNEEEFQKIYSEPVFTEEQKTKLLENIKNFEQWLIKIIKQ